MAKLARTRNTLGENARLTSVGLLNAALADLMDLTNGVRMAHWTVRGPHFAALHAKFEEFYGQLGEAVDDTAERIVQLGGAPDFNPDNLTERAHAQYAEGNGLRDMVFENLVAERIAIDSYREIVQYIGDKDPTTRRILRTSSLRKKSTPTTWPACWTA